MKSYIFRYISRTDHSRLKQTRPYYQETTLITLITLNNITNLTIWTDQKNYQEDKCKIRIDYFGLFEKLNKLEAKLNIGELKNLTSSQFVKVVFRAVCVTTRKIKNQWQLRRWELSERKLITFLVEIENTLFNTTIYI